MSWLRSSQGHTHFKVKVILESNGNVFLDFYPESGGWLLSECLSYLFNFWLIFAHMSPIYAHQIFSDSDL